MFIDLRQHRTIHGTHLACIIFRHIAQKSSAIHKVFPQIFGQSDENSDCAICAPELCGVALTTERLLLRCISYDDAAFFYTQNDPVFISSFAEGGFISSSARRGDFIEKGLFCPQTKETFFWIALRIWIENKAMEDFKG